MKKLIEALHVIQDECEKYGKNDNCCNCPMWSDESHVCCVYDLYPCDWKINDQVQKALL